MAPKIDVMVVNEANTPKQALLLLPLLLLGSMNSIRGPRGVVSSHILFRWEYEKANNAPSDVHVPLLTPLFFVPCIPNQLRCTVREVKEKDS